MRLTARNCSSWTVWVACTWAAACADDTIIVQTFSAQVGGEVVNGVVREPPGDVAAGELASSDVANSEASVPTPDTADVAADLAVSDAPGPDSATSCMPTGTGDPCNGIDDNCDGKTDDGGCDDNNVCTPGDACVNGGCSSGTAKVCDDGNACTADTCLPATGCASAGLASGCDDGSVCTTVDSCSNGSCQPGPKLGCLDGNPCTTDSCDGQKGCVFTVNTLPCDDSNACTAADSCSNGVCTGGTKLACDDGNPCTSDSCGTGACSHLPNTLPCNDQSACTYGEACIQGVCGGGLVSACADANPCTTDSCDPASGCKHSASTGVPCADGNLCTTGDSCTSAGQCTGAGTFTCTDGNPCTFDSCVVNVGCNYAPNSNPCSDGDACTSGDTCGTGQCTGTATNCEDSNPCTEDACAKTTGCLHIANAKPCDDGTVCTGPDACKDGNCGGVAVICDDANPCTTDACASTSGCSHAAVAANTKCGDIGVCLSGKCSPGSDVNPATSCLAIKQALPTAASGVYWLDPDQKGAGDKYQVFCEMVQYGGGWLRIDNNWANTLLVMTNPFLSSGLCKMTASELRAWDGFAGAPGYGHLCIATRPQGNFMAYSELRIEGVVLVGYTPGKGNTYDLTGDCYGFKHTGAVCAGPNDAQHPVYPSFKSVGNGEKMGPSTFAIALGKVYSDFQIRAREEGPQLEGIVWNSGAFWLR